MAQARQLRKPPIQEAVVQFVFSGVDLGLRELQDFAAVYEANGWKKNEVRSIAAEVDVGTAEEQPTVETKADVIGYILEDVDGKHLVQVRASQVSASTKQYESWESLTDQGRQAFETFVGFCNPTAVVQISARFINRIPARVGFSTYGRILSRPPLPIEGLDQAVVSDFMRRHVLKNLEGGYTANLTIGNVQLEPVVETEGHALVIDTDVFRRCEITPRFDDLVPELATIRSIKNKLFFGSLTEEIVETFE